MKARLVIKIDGKAVKEYDFEIPDDLLAKQTKTAGDVIIFEHAEDVFNRHVDWRVRITEAMTHNKAPQEPGG